MPRFKLVVEYDGTRYCGWQRQNDDPSVQEEIENALGVALGQQTPVVGSGRTDAGVHARGQIVHFDGDEVEDLFRLKGSLNGLLPADIAVSDVTQTRDDFHARYDAVSRRYHYYVSTHPTALDRSFRVVVPGDTDFNLMNGCAAGLVGTHDFSSFCRTQSETTNRQCTITAAHWQRESRDGYFFFGIAGNRFLHGMVRAIVGTLLEISRGKREPASIIGILARRDRRAAGEAAPAKGLVLEEVLYPDAPAGDVA
ncbi:MAG: tRNA pseudouridine(38-40) synthase TruA [Rhodothermia bacterium]|nr:tRNA pseudouridine(38-40) synthase TruA [Rhodothermia bacterium]